MTDLPPATAADGGAGLSVVELEAVLSRGWRGTVEQPLGGWLLRAADGFTSRANSVLPLGSPGLPVPDALGVVEGFYRSRGLPPTIQMPVDGPGSALAELDAALAARGWSLQTPNRVLTVELPDMLARLPGDPDPAVVLADVPDDGWLAGYRYRDAELPPSARAVLVRTERPVFAAVRDARGQAGVARGALTGDWLGVTAVTVPPDRRREGVASRLMAAVGRWALDRGATSVALQVDRTNTAALALYGRLGFGVHHAYHYRRAPDGSGRLPGSGTLPG